MLEAIVKAHHPFYLAVLNYSSIPYKIAELAIYDACAHNIGVYSPNKKDSLKWWNGKGKEYVEFCSFDTLQRLFETRFVKGKRGLDIFHAMGLTRRKLSK